MASTLLLTEGDRPRERLRDLGARSLGDAELVALVLGTGNGGGSACDVARDLLAAAGGLARLARLGPHGLADLPGVGEAKAARIAAAFELGLRVVEKTGRDGRSRGRFGCSADIYQAYRVRLALMQQEVFFAVGLNNKNEPIREALVAKGSLTECRVEPREVFCPMIAEAAARLALVHNHPSGDPRPSSHDVALTRRLVEVGELVGIPVLDHVVIGHGSYASLRDLGLLGGK
ncbi:MAG: DNA repair protein RadC [Deltaproteobacteria bacterium]|nr:DNA repair protein RadC [Deltaproteobacteria bacterium]